MSLTATVSPASGPAVAPLIGRAMSCGTNALPLRPDVSTTCSHVRIVGTSAALGRHPDDVLRRVLDVAGLAVHAVGGVDLQPLAATRLLDELVDASRTVPRFR